MTAKLISNEYVTELMERMRQGETPKKITGLKPAEFIKLMLPQVKIFLAQSFTHEEIAEFIGHVTESDLKKALDKEKRLLEKEAKKLKKKNPSK